MNRKPGFVGTVESVEMPTDQHVEAFKIAQMQSSETSEANPTFTLRGKGMQKRYRIPRNRYLEFYTNIINRRRAQPVYVEPENDDEYLVSRILIPQLRRVVGIRIGSVNVELRSQGSPLKLIMPSELFNTLKARLEEAIKNHDALLITHDPETHVVLDVSDPFDLSKARYLPEATQAGTEPISLKRAVKVFESIAHRREIPFDFPDEYCNARAHKMFRLLREMRLACEKIWNFADEGTQNDSSIRVFTPNHPAGEVSWGFHVAVLVKVRLPNSKGTVVDMVFDPALVKHPIRISDWVALQHDSTAVQERTRPEIYNQEFRGTNQQYDPDFTETEASLDVARTCSWGRKIELEKGDYEGLG